MTLNHKILPTKLENVGLRGVRQIVFNFLIDKKNNQFTVMAINRHKKYRQRSPTRLNIGISVAFSHINDVSNGGAKFSDVLVEDDTHLLMTDKTLDQLHTKVNDDLEKISRSVLGNDLAVNIKDYVKYQSRSVFIYLGPVPLRGFELQRVTSTEFLDVILDGNLNLKDDIICLHEFMEKKKKHAELYIRLDAALLLRDYGVKLSYFLCYYLGMFLAYNCMRGFVSQKKLIRIICF